MVANCGAVKSLVVETGLAGDLVITIFEAMIGPSNPYCRSSCKGS